MVAVGLLLVWWGAAVTTEDVGLSVPDWPLCYRKINPEGWYKIPALLLEHGHRWIAFIIGVLVFLFFSWQWFGEGRIKRGGAWLTWALLVVGLAALIPLMAIATYPEIEKRKPMLLWPALVIAAGLIGWLARGWSRWPVLLRFSALALLIVELQAVLGGMRVHQMNDAFGIVHGCLGQAFFSLLVVLALLCRPVAAVPLEEKKSSLRWMVWLLVIATFLQLIWGASVRHLHRIGLPADDILTTGGRFYPGLVPADMFFFFMHKIWALVVTVLVAVVYWRARRDLTSQPSWLRWIKIVPWLIVGQITLGVYVVWTETSFWVTNFHVLNGLSILACVVAFAVQYSRATRQ
jgi:heme A synthase